MHVTDETPQLAWAVASSSDIHLRHSPLGYIYHHCNKHTCKLEVRNSLVFPAMEMKFLGFKPNDGRVLLTCLTGPDEVEKILPVKDLVFLSTTEWKLSALIKEWPKKKYNTDSAPNRWVTVEVSHNDIQQSIHAALQTDGNKSELLLQGEKIFTQCYLPCSDLWIVYELNQSSVQSVILILVSTVVAPDCDGICSSELHQDG